MSVKFKDNEIFCPECGTIIKKGFYICPNCKLKVWLSGPLKAEKEDTSALGPVSSIEKEEKPLSIPGKSIASKEFTEEKEEEFDDSQTFVGKEWKDIEPEPEPEN